VGAIYRLIELPLIEASAVEDQPEALDEFLPPVPDHENRFTRFAVDVVVDLDRARRLVEQHIGPAPENLHIYVMWRNEWQKRLQEVELPAYERDEAGPSNQHRIG